MPSEFITNGQWLSMPRFAALLPKHTANLEFQNPRSMAGRKHTKREVRRAYKEKANS